MLGAELGALLAERLSAFSWYAVLGLDFLPFVAVVVIVVYVPVLGWVLGRVGVERCASRHGKPLRFQL